ncbi:MAG: hypothetical protein IT307_11445, partial [Chloroflexi bacterium]|nr:hypothetical protein [Chloroflexota bacterium]
GTAAHASPENENQPGGSVEVPSERQRRWLPLITIAWLVVMVAALIALFTFLFGLSF